MNVELTIEASPTFETAPASLSYAELLMNSQLIIFNLPVLSIAPQFEAVLLTNFTFFKVSFDYFKTELLMLTRQLLFS